MRYEITIFKTVIIVLFLTVILLSLVLVFTSKDRDYANTIIDHGQDRISVLHGDITDRDIVIMNQLEYYIFLQAILKNNDIEYEYYYYFLENYLYPNGEMNQACINRLQVEKLLYDLKESGTTELRGMSEYQ